MEKVLSSQATDWREGRRFRAVELSQLGWKQKDIARALGVTKGAVSQWLKRVKDNGIEGLRRRKGSGAPPKLSPAQRSQLPDLLAQGAESFGFRGALWTQPRIAQVIRRQFGIAYHPSQVGRILQALRWSRQKPVHRASQRDEAAIHRWREERWPQLKKRQERKSGPWFSSTSPGSTCCRPWCGLMLPWEKRRLFVPR